MVSFRKQDPRFTIARAYAYYSSQAGLSKKDKDYSAFYSHNYMGQKALDLMLGGEYLDHES